MSITLEKSKITFPVPDPRVDFVQGRSFIYWGSCNKEEADKVLDEVIYDEMRAILIREHVFSNDHKLRTLEGLVAFKKKSISLFNWQFPVRDMCKRASVWQCVAYTACAIGFFLVVLRVNFLGFKLFKSVRFQYPDAFLYLMALNAIIYFIVENLLVEIFEETLETPFKEWILIQRYVNKNSSMKERKLEELANEKEGEGWRDPITLEVLSQDTIRSPRILNIGKHAFNIQSVLKMMLTRNCCHNEEIPHPLENRVLNPEECKKFVDDICSFFCIGNKEEFLKCWDVISEVNEQMQKLDLSFLTFESNISAEEITSMKDQVENQLKVFYRTFKFLELVPDSVRQMKCMPKCCESPIKFTLSNSLEISFSFKVVDDEVKLEIDSHDSLTGLLYQ